MVPNAVICCDHDADYWNQSMTACHCQAWHIFAPHALDGVAQLVEESFCLAMHKWNVCLQLHGKSHMIPDGIGTGERDELE